jgi:hypothetical protein
LPSIHRLHSLLRSFLSLEEAGNPESAKDSVRYRCTKVPHARPSLKKVNSAGLWWPLTLTKER